MKKHLFNPEKLKYVQGKRTDISCLLCAMRDRNPEIANLEVFRSDHSIVAVNLFPFNAGHLMIFPRRHVERLGDLSDDEAMDMHRLLVRTISILDEEFSPSGYNAGYNLGQNSGASVSHVHLHVVPRYGNEVGFMEVLAGTKLVVSDPAKDMARLRKRYSSNA